MSGRGDDNVFMGKLCEKENSQKIQILSSTLGRFKERARKSGWEGSGKRLGRELGPSVLDCPACVSCIAISSWPQLPPPSYISETL